MCRLHGFCHSHSFPPVFHFCVETSQSLPHINLSVQSPAHHVCYRRTYIAADRLRREEGGETETGIGTETDTEEAGMGGTGEEEEGEANITDREGSSTWVQGAGAVQQGPHPCRPIRMLCACACVCVRARARECVWVRVGVCVHLVGMGGTGGEREGATITDGEGSSTWGQGAGAVQQGPHHCRPIRMLCACACNVVCARARARVCVCVCVLVLVWDGKHDGIHSRARTTTQFSGLHTHPPIHTGGRSLGRDGRLQAKEEAVVAVGTIRTGGRETGAETGAKAGDIQSMAAACVCVCAWVGVGGWVFLSRARLSVLLRHAVSSLFRYLCPQQP